MFRPPREIKEYREGNRLSASEFNSLVERVKRLEKLQVHQPLQLINEATSPILMLNRIYIDLVMFELEDDLQIGGVANATRLFWDGINGNFIRDPKAVDNNRFIKVRDTFFLFSGTGKTEEREGDKGFASLFPGNNVHYEIVSMQQNARMILFRAKSNFTQNAGSVTASVADYFGGRFPGTSEESSSSASGGDLVVYNPDAYESAHMFSGREGQYGWATWDNKSRKYWIIQMEC